MIPIRRIHCGIIAFLACLSVLSHAHGQELAVPGYPVAVEVPGAHRLPDPNAIYKVVFDITHKGAQPTDVNPGLIGVAKYVNTLAKFGVPRDHRKIAVVFHQDALDIVVNNDTWKATHNGADNPNVPLVAALAKAGVELHVCGQGVTRTHIDPKTLQPEIELDLWALTTLIDLEQQGYVRVSD
jgi:intracellular sulfur oxidation DsrE/DsrF family protein